MSIKSAVCAVAICLTSGAAVAQPLPAGPVAGLGPIMPPAQISKILRARGFAPQATPVRLGEAYQVRAIDRYGRQVRVAIDARYGDILMARPIAMVPPGAYGPRPYGTPGYYDDMATGAIGAYPPGRAAALTPANPPVPRPKPAAKPAAAAAAPSAAPEAAPTPAANAAPAASTPAEPPAAAPAASTPAASPPAAAPSMPPVAPLE